MHDIYFTLSRIAAIIGFTMFRRGVCAAPRNAVFHILFHIFSIFMYFGFRYISPCAPNIFIPFYHLLRARFFVRLNPVPLPASYTGTVLLLHSLL